MAWWTEAGWVALGGALGALGRTGLGALVTGWLGHAAFGTFAANVIGCFLMGMGRAAVTNLDWGSPATRLLLFSGFLGAFTTFSTFEADTVSLWAQGPRALAVLYLVGSVLAGLLAFGLGWWSLGRLWGG